MKHWIIRRKEKSLIWVAYTMVFLFLMSIGIVLVDTAQAAQQPTSIADTAVAQFFPQRLIDESEKDVNIGGPTPSKFSNFAIGDLNHDGMNNYVVAAYTNGFSAVIRVLRQQGNTFLLVDEPNFPTLSGILPDVQLFDLDNDGKPEAIISFSSASGPSAEWIFKWNGTALKLIGPTLTDQDGYISTVLSEADFIDLDGDGVMEIVNPSQSKTSQPFNVYKLNGEFVESLYFYRTYIRNSGVPVVTTRTFSVKNLNIPYSLTIINGDNMGAHRVSSAVVSLNGGIIADPELFNQNVPKISIPISPLASNTISVELRSNPGSKISIIVEAQQ